MPVSHSTSGQSGILSVGFPCLWCLPVLWVGDMGSSYNTLVN